MKVCSLQRLRLEASLKHIVACPECSAWFIQATTLGFDLQPSAQLRASATPVRSTSFCHANYRTWVIDEFVLYPTKTPHTGGTASHPTFARFRRAALRSWCSPSSAGGAASVEPRSTAVHRCPTQAPPKAMSRPVWSVDGCLSPSLWQGRASRLPGRGCQLETLGSSRDAAALRQTISDLCIVWNYRNRLVDI